MKYSRIGQRTESPSEIAVQPGTKQIVTLRLLVDVEEETVAGDVLRNAETCLTGGPVIDWAFEAFTEYTLPDSYEEGDAFKHLDPDSPMSVGDRMAAEHPPEHADRVIHRYPCSLVLEVVSGVETATWVVSLGRDIVGVPLLSTVSVSDTLRATLGAVKSGDRIRGTQVCTQYLTRNGALRQRNQLVSAVPFEGGVK